MLAESAKTTRSKRGEETKQRLVSAAYEIIRKDGHAALRSALVSEVSGVSRGGQLHHFETKEKLVAAVFEATFLTLEEQSWSNIKAASDATVLEDLVQDAKQRFFGEDFLVLLDIRIASSKEKPLREKLAQLTSSERELARDGWAARIAAAGVESEVAGQVAAFLWNCVKGLAIRGLVRSGDEHAARVLGLALRLAHDRTGLPDART